MIMEADSQNLKAVVALLFSVSLFHLSLFQPVETAPIDSIDEGAGGQLVPPTILPIISTRFNILNSEEISTPPPPGPNQPPLIDGMVTIGEEGFLTSRSTTESILTITNEMNLLPNSDTDTDRGTELDHGRRHSPSAGFLLYEVERDILGLSLDDVNYILNFGPEVFAYSLVDKLGYLQKVNGGDVDDPHISVIEANKERLMEKLKNLVVKQDVHNIIITTEEPTLLLDPEPIITTDPIQRQASSPHQEMLLDLSREQNNLVDPQIIMITTQPQDSTSQVVTPEMTTESKAAESYYEVTTIAHDLAVSTDSEIDPHRYDANFTPNIDPRPGAIPVEEILSDIDGESSSFLRQMLNDDQFLATLSNKNKELYLKLNRAELDGEAASNLLDWYRAWVNDQIEDSHYGGPDGYYDDDDDVMADVGDEIGATEGQEVKQEVKPEVEQGAMNDGGEEKKIDDSENKEAIGMVYVCIKLCSCLATKAIIGNLSAF
jgi:hypothetical protein